MRMLFDPRTGDGLSYLRQPIGGSDFVATAFGVLEGDRSFTYTLDRNRTGSRPAGGKPGGPRR